MTDSHACRIIAGLVTEQDTVTHCVTSLSVVGVFFMTTFYDNFLDQSRYFSIQVAPQLSSRGWVDTTQDPLLLRKSGNAGNRTRDLYICSQEHWPLDHNIKNKKKVQKNWVPLEPPEIIQNHKTVYSFMYNNEICLWL
jgi:hypothetical protein